MTDTELIAPDDYDSPWKDVLEHAFPEFMAFYFPDACAQIDWAQGHEFQNVELRKVVRDAALGKRFADALVQVVLQSGATRLIYIHVEVQGQRDADFEPRMFTYNYRFYDRFGVPVASFAVLADDDEGWRPDHFGFEVLGCRQRLDFPMVKLLDYAPRLEQLEAESNPFAIITAAHLRTRSTKRDPQARYQAKRHLVRQLYRHGWERQRVLDLFAVLDWMMRLPDLLEQQLWQDIAFIEGETRMRYVTSVERLATQRGMQQGLEQGLEQGMEQGLEQGMEQGKLEGEIGMLERLLIRRFGSLSDETAARLKNATSEQIELWADRILDAPTLAAVFMQN